MFAGIFHQFDVDNSGTIDMNEFCSIVQEPRARALLSKLGIEMMPEDSQELFSLLDFDQSQEIDFNEFMTGILKMRGNAKSVEMAKVMAKCEQIVQYMDTLVAQLGPAHRHLG